MTQLPITTEAGEPRTGVVIPIFHPKADLGEYLAPKVALLKAIFGIDDNGQLTKPAPPKWFSQQVFEYIMGGKIPPTNRLLTSAETTRKPRRPSIRKLIENAEKAGKPVTSVTTPDGTKLDFSKAPNAPADDEVENWLSKQKRH